VKLVKLLGVQLLELFKLYAISLIPLLLISTNRIINWNEQPEILLDTLSVPGMAIGSLVFYYPPVIVFLLWLSIAHVIAVQKKMNKTEIASQSKLVRFLLNRLIILLAGVLILSPLALGDNAFMLLFAAYVLVTYSVYLLISRIRFRKTNA
jgi:hypothetical protein